MKATIVCLALAAGLVPGFHRSTAAEPVQLRPAQILADGASALLPGTAGAGYAIPWVTDWNGDGKKDLLVGYQNAGKIALYLNSGTDSQPRFTNFTTLKTGDGMDIWHLSSGCGAPAPWVGDFDGDGRRDLLVGAGADGTVWFYRNTNSDNAPILDLGVELKVGAVPLSVGIRATPYVYDWDADGRPDLLCGAGDGYVYFFQNTNTVKAPQFAPATRLQAGGTNLFLGIRSVIRVYDWDGDGRMDLVCSSDTGVYWCRNTGNNSQPVLDAPLPICAPVAGQGLVPILTGSVPGARMRLELVDWDNDGVVDLLVGNHDGTVYLYQGYRFRIANLMPQNNALTLQWASAPYLTYNVLLSGCPTNVTCPGALNIPSGGNSTSWTAPRVNPEQFFRVQLAQ